MLALVTNFAQLSKVGLTDMACSPHPVTGFSEHQIRAASPAALLEDNAVFGPVLLGDAVALIVGLAATLTRSHAGD